MPGSSRKTTRHIAIGLALAGPGLIAYGLLVDLAGGLPFSRFASSFGQWALLVSGLGVAALLLESVVDRMLSRGDRTAQRRLADDLEALLTGALTSDEFRRKYGTSHLPSAALEALPDLDHYLDDADIRERDEAYRQMQDLELTKLIALLREGAPGWQLEQVHFLGPSQKITRPGRFWRNEP